MSCLIVSQNLNEIIQTILKDPKSASVLKADDIIAKKMSDSVTYSGSLSSRIMKNPVRNRRDANTVMVTLMRCNYLRLLRWEILTRVNRAVPRRTTLSPALIVPVI